MLLCTFWKFELKRLIVFGVFVGANNFRLVSRVLGRQEGETDLGVGRPSSLLVWNLGGFVHCYVQPFASETVVESDMNASAFRHFL